MKKLFVLAAPFAALVMAGCATKIAGLKQSPTFTYPSIAGGKMAVGGVVAAYDNLDEGRRTTYANLLRTNILEERKEYNIAPVGVVINKVGKSQYVSLMNEFQSTGALSDHSIATLKNKMGDIRYVIFSRIENDDVSTDRRDSNETDKNGRVIPGSEKVTASASRSATASLHVYDLKSKDEAFSGTVTKSMSDSRTYHREKDNDLVAVIKAVQNNPGSSEEQRYPYPPAPDTSKVLSKVYEGFGEKFPKKD